jgi:hypothetical protein
MHPPPSFIFLTSNSSPQPGQLSISPFSVSLGMVNSNSQSGHLVLLSLFWKFEFVGFIIVFSLVFGLFFLWLWISFKYCDFYVTNYAICVLFGTINFQYIEKAFILATKPLTANGRVMKKGKQGIG